jgi:ectoine hydroxylase
MSTDPQSFDLSAAAALAPELPNIAAEFWRRGFVVLRNVFAPEEMGVLGRVITSNATMNQRSERVHAKYKAGAFPSFETIFVWNDTLATDVFAKATRNHKIIDVLESSFDDRVYVYHNKVTLKYPGMPGFRFHQDYYYWYYMGNLYPDMATAFIAVDPATRSNGCLNVIEGSHKLGRLEHKHYDGMSDSGVDPERLRFVRERLPERPLELDVGDVAIFHCNTLHGADSNESDSSRLALLGCYNTRHNDPCNDGLHPRFMDQPKIYEPITDADANDLPVFTWAHLET